MKKYTLKQLKYGTPAVAEVKLTYSSKIRPEDRRECNGPDELFQVLAEWWDRETIELCEAFAVLLMDRRNRVIGIYDHARGGTSAVSLDTKLILAAAIKSRAEAVILAHNHPSGQLSPSQADILLTKQFVTAAKLHGIQVLDHQILTPGGDYYSFAIHLPDALKGYDLKGM